MTTENDSSKQEASSLHSPGSPSLGETTPSAATEDGAGGGVGGLPIECPQCHHGFHVAPSFCVPKEQVIYLEMGCKSEFFAAELIGQQIVNMEKLLRCIAKDAGAKCVVFMKSIELEPNKVKLGFLVVDAPAGGRRGKGRGEKASATEAKENAEVSDGGPLTHESPAAQSRRSLH